MFDSLNYFQRNKIKTIYCEADQWWYGHPFKKWEIVFDKNKNSTRYKSIVPRYRDGQLIQNLISYLCQDRYFKFRDTTFYTIDNNISREIKYSFDNNMRLKRQETIDYQSSRESQYGFRFSTKDSAASLKPSSSKSNKHITSITYIYEDSDNNKIKKIIEESPNYVAITNFYYEQFLLSTKTKLDSNKITNEIKFESIAYDYYPDRKLKRETRRVADGRCPGLAGNTICQGTIIYKYDTEFKDDLTPIPDVQYIPLIAVNNNCNSNIYVELWGYEDKNDQPKRIKTDFNIIQPEDDYELFYEPAPDCNCIHQRRKRYNFSFELNKYHDIEVRVYTLSEIKRVFDAEKEKKLFSKKYTVRRLLKRPKQIKIG